MDTEKSPLAETIPAPTASDISTEGSDEQYHGSIVEIERSKVRTLRRFFSRLEYVLPWGLISLIGVALIGIAAALIVWLVHILIPTDWQWLEKERIERLQDFFLSGVSGALFAKFLQWYSGRENNQKN